MSDEMATIAAFFSDHHVVGGWNLVPALSSFTFSNKTIWGLITVKGQFAEFRGDGQVTDTGAVFGRLDLTAASLYTGNGKRHKHLRSADFFDVEKFPAISVIVTAATPSGGDTVNVLADINIKGISHPLPLHATVAVLDDGAVRVSAPTTVDREQLGVRGNLFGMVGAATHLLADAVFHPRNDGHFSRPDCLPTSRRHELGLSDDAIESTKRKTWKGNPDRPSKGSSIMRIGLKYIASALAAGAAAVAIGAAPIAAADPAPAKPATIAAAPTVETVGWHGGGWHGGGWHGGGWRGDYRGEYGWGPWFHPWGWPW
jgi:polyisoprenoid-binding protein YceI